MDDLLAHVISWWHNGARVIETMRKDQTLSLPDFDVDAFNAQVVEKSRLLSDSAFIQAYETQRQAMVGLAKNLPDPEESV